MLAQPFRDQLQGIVPEGVNFDRFAAAGRYHPVAHLRVHPGELITVCPLRSRPSFGSTWILNFVSRK